MEPIIGAGAPAGAPADLIKDTDTRSFMADVIDASQEVPVVVDFWAPWCGPCKQLGPMLERAVTQAGGAVRLVKVDIDRNQDIARQMRIQSIPAVYAFFQGRPVDGFVGAVPESQIKSFVQRLAELGGGAPGEEDAAAVEQALEQAKALLDQGDADTASALYGQILEHDPENLAAMAGLIRARLAAGHLGEARAMLESVPADKAEAPEIAAARAAIDLAEKAKGASGRLPEFESRLAADPADHQARFDLAIALHAGGDTERAIEELVEIVRRKRDWNDDAARKQLVQIFEALGPAHEFTLWGRRRLSSVLFS